MGGKSFGRLFVNLILIFALTAQNLLYAGGPGSQRRLEDPLLTADYLVGPQRGQLEEKPDLELATLSSAASEGDLETESRPESLLAPLSADATTFLDRYGLTADHLRERDISFADFQRLFDVDTSWRTSFRWMAVDSVVEKVLDYPVLGRSALTHEDGLKREHCSPRVWISGRDMPVLSPRTRQNLLFMEGFRNGAAFIFFRELHLAVLGFLGYDLATSIRDGTLSFPALVSVFRSQETATVNYLLGLLQNPAGPAIISGILGAPFVWGVAKGLWNIIDGKRLTPQRRTNLQEEINAYPKGTWADLGRWLLPFHPLERRLNSLIRALRFNGEMPPKAVETLFETLGRVATERGGYSQIVAMHHLANLAYGINLSDYRKLIRDPQHITREEQDRLLAYLQVKLHSAELIREMAEGFRHKWKTRDSFGQGVDRLWKGTYAKYLQWSLGQDNWGWLTMGSLKAGKGVLFGFFLKTLIESLIEYFYCPNEFQNLRYGAIGPISDTPGCFTEYVRIFNQIPGQPVETLTDLIPNVAFQGNQYQLDLSNKGLNATAIVQILRAFKQNGIALTTLNLSGNLGFNNTTPQEYQQLGQAIGQHEILQSLGVANNFLGFFSHISFLLDGWRGIHSNLLSLDLSGNYFGNSDEVETIALGEALISFPNLTFLNVSNNNIGGTGDTGTIALSQGLRSLSKLSCLDLNSNLIGSTADNGTIALGEALPFLSQLVYLDLGTTIIGFTGDAGTVALGKGLFSLQNLAYLSFGGQRGTDIGFTDSSGTVAIGEALQNLSHLTYLDLRNANIGKTGDAGIQALVAGFSGTPNLQTFLFFPQEATLSAGELNLLNTGLQQTKAGPLPFVLLTEEDIQNYVAGLPQTTTAINLSGHLSNPSATMMQALFQELQARSLNITKLILSNAGIGSADTSAAVAIGEGLPYLPNLRYLDLNYNYIGHAGDAGAAAIGNALLYLPNLTYLNLSANPIGKTGEEGAAAIGNALPYLPNLTYLDLSYNLIGATGDTGTVAIWNGLQFLSNLTYLNLSGNEIGFIGDAAGAILRNGRQFLPNLTYLDLSSDGIGLAGDAVTVAIGNGLQSLPNLTYLDLSINFIGQTGDAGTIALGEGLRNKTALTTLNLSGNYLGQYGSQGVEIILQNVVREGLNLNLGGAVGIPWTVGAQALATLNAGPVAAACYQQRCFGDTPAQNTTTIQSVGARRVLAVEEVLAGEENETSAESSRPGFLTRWGQSVRGFVTHATTSTKQTVWSYWDAFGTWLTNALTDAAHEVVTNSHSYFPNGNNPDVRDWPIGGVFFNTTSPAPSAPALPAVPAYALP